MQHRLNQKMKFLDLRMIATVFYVQLKNLLLFRSCANNDDKYRDPPIERI